MVDKSLSQKISKGIIMVLLSIAAILAILPFLHIIAVSFSGMQAAEANLVSFWPVNLDFQAWQQVLTDERMWKAMGVSAKVLGLDEFDSNAFDEQIEKVIVVGDDLLDAASRT